MKYTKTTAFAVLLSMLFVVLVFSSFEDGKVKSDSVTDPAKTEIDGFDDKEYSQDTVKTKTGEQGTDQNPQKESKQSKFWWGVLVGVILLFVVQRLPKLISKNKKTKVMEENNNKPTFNEENTAPLQVEVEKQPANKPTKPHPSICASASNTMKTINQDSHCSNYVEKCQAQIIAVADGVGSSYKAEIGSAYVAKKAVELVSEAVERDEYNIDFVSIFDAIQEGLDKEIERQFADQLSELPDTPFGTTLIVGIDFPNRFVAAYVGNGGILHVSSLFTSFPAYINMPWNAPNLLNPNSIENQGKEALFRMFYYKGNHHQHVPSVIRVDKPCERPGELFVITTDGVTSLDQQVASKDDSGSTWIPCDDQLLLLFDRLKAYLMGQEDINEVTLKQTLDNYLDILKETKKMDDDTTLGVFISQEAKNYFIDKRKPANNETN